METLTGLLKKGQEILVQAGIEEAGWMPASFWNISQEKAGRITLHTEKNVLQKRQRTGIWSWSQVARSISLFSI